MSEEQAEYAVETKQRKARKQSVKMDDCILYLRHVLAMKGLKFERFMDKINIQIPDDPFEWVKLVEGLESQVNDTQDKVVESVKTGLAKDRDGNVVKIESGRVLRNILGTWIDTGSATKHPKLPFTPIGEQK
jgi:hypothetical protein